jgi:hypothetical protein
MELKKILFHHLPKCYGHTIRNVHDQIEEQLINDPDVALKIPRFFHLPLPHLIRAIHQPQRRPIQSTVPLTPNQIQDRRKAIARAEKLDTLNSPWFLFTFVRHPYERLVSVWNFFQEQKKFNPIKMDVERRPDHQNFTPDSPPIEDPRRMTFSKKVAADFLKYKYGDLNGFLEDTEYFKMFMNSHDFLWFNTMSSFCNNDWSSYNKIYKCENFSSEIERYLDDIGVKEKVNINLIKTNASEKDFNVDDLTEKSKNIIYELYIKDFEFLNYNR